jgi:hypothetical protein
VSEEELAVAHGDVGGGCTRGQWEAIVDRHDVRLGLANVKAEDRTATQDETSANEWAQGDIEMVTWIGGGGAETWSVGSCGVGVGVGGLRGGGLAFEGVMLR